MASCCVFLVFIFSVSDIGGGGNFCFVGFVVIAMGCFDEGHFNGELENGVSNIGCGEVGFEEEANTTAAIEDAVKVLLLGLGEDINREGLRKTPLRVAKALREGTRGDFIYYPFLKLFGLMVFVWSCGFLKV